MTFRDVNLQGPFTIERDLNIASGARLCLLPGKQNVPGIFTTTSLDIASNGSHTIYVYGTLTISPTAGDNQGTSISINAPIIVKSGGTLIINKIRSNVPVLFNSLITVEKGGRLQFNAGSFVLCQNQTLKCNGKLYFDGTSSEHVVFKAVQSDMTTPGSVNIEMIGDGDNMFTTTKLKVAYAELYNTFIAAVNISAYSPTVSHSTFVLVQNSAIKLALSLLYIDYRQLTSPTNGGVSIEYSTFTDNTNASIHNYSGLVCNKPYSLSVNYCTFHNLCGGITTGGSRRGVTINGSQFSNHYQAIICTDDMVRMCHDTLYECEYGFVPFGSASATVIESYFSNNSSGIRPWSTAEIFLRGNLFDQYCNAIEATASQLTLRPIIVPYPTDMIKYGRNVFISDATGGYGGCGTHDIKMWRQTVLNIMCGWNSMASGSVCHIYDVGNLPVNSFNPSFNRWNPGNPYQVRVCTGNQPTGTDLDKSTSASGCEIQYVSACEYDLICPTGNSGELMSLLPRDSTLINAYNSCISSMQDTSISSNCRLNHARTALLVSKLIDSVVLVENVKNTCIAAISAAGSDSTLISGLKLVTGLAYESLDSSTMARDQYTDIVHNFRTSTDSVPANWRLLALNIPEAADSLRDSVFYCYHSRILRDLRLRQDTSQLLFAKSDTEDREVRIQNSDVFYVKSCSPNPFTESCTVEYYIPVASVVDVTVYDNEGNKVTIIDNGRMTTGMHSSTFDATAVPSGSYMIQICVESKVCYVKKISKMK